MWLVGPDDFCFFFQAEDGIRDYKVTGVQTCALPIFPITARTGFWMKKWRSISSAMAARKIPSAESPHDHRVRSEEHTSELQSPCNLVCRLLLEKKKKKNHIHLGA